MGDYVWAVLVLILLYCFFGILELEILELDRVVIVGRGLLGLQAHRFVAGVAPIAALVRLGAAAKPLAKLPSARNSRSFRRGALSLRRHCLQFFPSPDETIVH